MKRRRFAAGLGAGLLAGAARRACGSDSTTTEEASVETYVTVPAAQVVSGLAGTQQLMETMVADPSTANQSTVDGVNNSWLIYEGNVRLDDAASYLAAEDALALF